MSGLIGSSLAGDQPGSETITIRFKNDRRYFSDTDAEKISACFNNALGLMAGAGGTVSEIAAKIRAVAGYVVPGRVEAEHVYQPVSSPAASSRQLTQAVAEEFSGLLGHPVRSTDNFFELGGTSFKALQLIGYLCEIFKADIPLEFFFKNPTPGAISNLLEEMGVGPVTTQAAEGI